ANSAYYGLSGLVSSIQHASILLGQRTLGELITIAASSRLLSKKLKGYQLNPGDLWKHSLAV
ncbi:HDOD domain-containing protein, partial [Candidatus Saccharibacteria bacterium]|nr:HDOD domain-containing protein [Candidatus Saccharibacteria bacterium]NIW80183.1 HDOD domain-containing protein [Calditrichia bacterium]